jgi:DNA-binding NarL/FixJ family response regulator
MKKRILLVDDHSTIRVAVRAMMGGNYAVCGEAANGQEAVEKAVELKPDLILMDIHMPVMNGIDAAKKIRQAMPGAKILIFSIHDSLQIEAEAKSAGTEGVVCKTAPRQDILAAIERVLAD